MSALMWPPRQRDDYERWYPPDWTEQAVCASVDPEIFFLEKGGSPRKAKRICSRCPVSEPCLEYALENDENRGIWAGTTEADRRELRRPRQKGLAA